MKKPEPVLKLHPIFEWAQELCIASRIWQKSLTWDETTAVDYKARGLSTQQLYGSVKALVRLAGRDVGATVSDIATYLGLDRDKIDEILAPVTVD